MWIVVFYSILIDPVAEFLLELHENGHILNLEIGILLRILLLRILLNLVNLDFKIFKLASIWLRRLFYLWQVQIAFVCEFNRILRSVNATLTIKVLVLNKIFRFHTIHTKIRVPYLWAFFYLHIFRSTAI